MPTPAQDVSNIAPVTRSNQLNAEFSQQPTPYVGRVRSMQEPETLRSAQAVLYHAEAMDDNTAAGMALSQEESMYSDPLRIPGGYMELSDDIGDKMPAATSADGTKVEASPPKSNGPPDVDMAEPEDVRSPQSPLSSSSTTSLYPQSSSATTPDVGALSQSHGGAPGPSTDEQAESPNTARGWRGSSKQRARRVPLGLAEVDLTLDRSMSTRPWDLPELRRDVKYPPSLFRSCSKFSGTQQSDRNIYNVEVTILTVDMEQCSLSGYLLIRGLTPEHDTLQTFFTGEIIGGPNQRHSFRTGDPTWGANDKTDLTHWLRFPAWRHLCSHAKRDMTFTYPLDNEPWWQQEHIFMRWKEHFLVPDHRTRSIRGASFEGFYYIDLNQREGNISGIYFHSKSEKYQQLELKHDSRHGITGPNDFAVAEFR